MNDDLLVLSLFAALAVAVFCAFRFLGRQRPGLAAKNTAYVFSVCVVALVGAFALSGSDELIGASMESGCAVFLLAKYLFKKSLLAALAWTLVCTGLAAAVAAVIISTQPGFSQSERAAAILAVPVIWALLFYFSRRVNRKRTPPAGEKAPV